MKKEEAIEILTHPDEEYHSSDGTVGYTFNPNRKNYEAFQLAVKALEQEPILDKIRAELHSTAEMHEDGGYYLRDEWIDEYFDKYKAESEDKK